MSNFNLMGSQLFDNRYIWGYRHLYSAIWHALNAEKNQSKISNTLSMEILLYVAGQRQIKKALKLLGIKKSTEEIVGVLIGKNKQQLIEAELEVEQKLQFQLDLHIIDDFPSKSEYIVDMLCKEGYLARNFSLLEIEKAILQRIALLALES